MTSEVLIFSDGACSLDGTATGAGILIRGSGGVVLALRPLTGIASTSVEAEMLALCEAVRIAHDYFPGATRIAALLDSESVVRSVKGWDEPEGRVGAALNALRVMLGREGIPLEAHWTKGHADEGTPYGFANAAVDRLAKHGMRTGERFITELPCTDADWSTAVTAAHPCLRQQPRYVGHRTAAAWLGVPVSSIPGMLGGKGLVAADTDLVTMGSVRQVRRDSMALRLPMPAMGGWSPGPLEMPRVPEAPTVCVDVIAGDGSASVGASARSSDTIHLDGMRYAAPEGPVVATLDGVRFALLRLSGRLPPLSEVRLHLRSDVVRDLIDRTIHPEGAAERRSLWQLRNAVSRCRARLRVQPQPAPNPEVRALFTMATNLAWQARAGANVESRADAVEGWHLRPEFFGNIGMPLPAAGDDLDASDDAEESPASRLG